MKRMVLGYGVVLVGAATVTALAAGTATAGWVVTSEPGNGTIAMAAMPGGNQPVAVAHGSAVTVTWPASRIGGVPVSGYSVRRYSATTGVLSAVGGACAEVVHELSCVETSVPRGDWRYTVRPRQGTAWVGDESASSIAVVVGGDVTVQVNVADPQPAGTTTQPGEPSVVGDASGAGGASVAGGATVVSGASGAGGAGGATTAPVTTPTTDAPTAPAATTDPGSASE